MTENSTISPPELYTKDLYSLFDFHDYVEGEFSYGTYNHFVRILCIHVEDKNSLQEDLLLNQSVEMRVAVLTQIIEYQIDLIQAYIMRKYPAIALPLPEPENEQERVQQELESRLLYDDIAEDKMTFFTQMANILHQCGIPDQIIAYCFSPHYLTLEFSEAYIPKATKEFYASIPVPNIKTDW